MAEAIPKRSAEDYYPRESYQDIDYIGRIPETTAHGAIPWDAIRNNGE
jgi:hypothetical protein